MGLVERFKRGFGAFVSVPEAEARKTIDIVLDPSTTPEDLENYVEKQSSKSKLDIRETRSDLAMSIWGGLRAFYNRHLTKIPPYDDPSRDIYISEIWRHEPILAGAVYSMTAKMSAMRWTVTGRRKKAMDAARILAEAAHFDGYDWGGFIKSTAGDYYTTNRGVFWETPRFGSSVYGKLAELGHIDSLNCELTGNKKFPMLYGSDTTGQTIRFKHGEYIHFTSQVSPRERHLGMGFCAVDRSYRALKLLMGLHDYDDEKLNNLPPEGVATISGLTMDEFNDAVALWKAQRTADKALTFPQVLWLIGSSPNAKIELSIQGFSTLPESFNRNDVVQHYISTLALDFGVDAREFWPISSGSLGTASESEIQHLKAKGKGPGEFISDTERHINGELDEDTQFAFDTADIEEDMNAAVVSKAWVDAYYPLFAGAPAGKSKASPGGKPNTEMIPDPKEIQQSDAMGQAQTAAGPMPGAEQVITKEELLRLLADRHVIPEWMMNDKRQMVLDTSIHISKELDPDEYTSFVWDGRVLKEHRLPAIDLDVPDAVVEKSKEDAPNYRKAEGKRRCDNCKHSDGLKPPDFESLHCDKFDFLAQYDHVCDAHAWGNQGVEQKALRYLKQVEDEVFQTQRNIRGDPIPEQEVTRGARVTANTLRDELERWRKHPILSKYALTEEELLAKIEAK